MNGDEVNALMELEARASLDENKTIEQLLVKLNVFDVAFHNFEALQVESKDIIEGDNFAFVPFPCGAFVDILVEAFLILGQDRSKKFLDVGCGAGSKVILSCSLFDGYGIDYNPSYVEKAKLLGLNRVGLADALNFDKYDVFDVIYYYRPIHNIEKYHEFEQKVHKEMRPGVLVSPMFSKYEWDDAPDMEKLTRFLYRKKF